MCVIFFPLFTSYQNQFYDLFIYKEPTVIPLLFYIWSENDVCQSFFSIFFCWLLLVMMMGEPCSSALTYLLTLYIPFNLALAPCLACKVYTLQWKNLYPLPIELVRNKMKWSNMIKMTIWHYTRAVVFRKINFYDSQSWIRGRIRCCFLIHKNLKSVTA
jgi:hypothetical protein